MLRPVATHSNGTMRHDAQRAWRRVFKAAARTRRRTSLSERARPQAARRPRAATSSSGGCALAGRSRGRGGTARRRRCCGAASALQRPPRSASGRSGSPSCCGTVRYDVLNCANEAVRTKFLYKETKPSRSTRLARPRQPRERARASVPAVTLSCMHAETCTHT